MREFKKNEYLETEIIDMDDSGQGIGKIDGFTLFIKDAVIGDVVYAKLMKVKKNYGFAKLEKVLSPSPFRIEPKCRFAKECGGCQLQALSYEAQLRFKENKVLNHLVRIGGFDEGFIREVMEPIIGMAEPYHYRNKAQYPVGRDKKEQAVAGFYAGRTHDIIANTDCHLGYKENQDILKTILAFLNTYHIAPYDEGSQKGYVRHILIRQGYVSGEIMVCLVINADELPKADRLVEKLITNERIKSICLSINKEKTNVIMGKEIKVLYGKGTISDELGGITFEISPLSFYQINPVQTEKLYAKALEYAQLHGEETVWDLYCGIGTISLFMAKQAKHVYGVEIIPEAIEDAKRNALRNHISNAEFYVGKAEEVLPQFYEKEKASGRQATADVIVVDPPRKGCDEVCLETMLKMKPKRIVYVSCDSATLARDLRILCEKEYKLEKVQCVDQFGQTVHVETVALLSQRKADDYVEVELELDELDLTTAANLENDNSQGIPKSEDSRQPQCLVEKEKAIRDALEHFGMI